MTDSNAAGHSQDGQDRPGDLRRVIAIDGPGAAGKSTVARLLAKRLGIFVFDTGALYRAVTLLALRQGVSPGDGAALATIARHLDIIMAPPTVNDGRQVDVRLGDEDITWAVRAPAIDAAVSEVSAHQDVRDALLPIQRRIADGVAVVMVGRDIGTVIAPDAGTKFYLDASADERARRRLVDLRARGVETDFAAVLADLEARDAWDTSRDLSPLHAAPDAIVIDSDGRTAEEVAAEMAKIAREHWAAHSAGSASMTTRDASSGSGGEVDLRNGTLQGVWFGLARRILLTLCRVILRFEVEGVEHIPHSGGALIVSNHLHNADPVFVCMACPRPIHYMAKDDLFRVPGIGWLIARLGAFPVDRDRLDRKALRRAEATLRQGIALGIFPEGTRSRTHRIEKVHSGVGMFALRADAPIVPVAITGSEHLPLNGAKTDRSGPRHFRPRVAITFGEPFTLPHRADGSRMGVAEATDEIMRRVAAMLPEQYRGIYGYGSSPAKDSAKASSSIAAGDPSSS